MPTPVAHQWIDTPEKLRHVLPGSSTPQILALDTEFMRRNTFYPQLALLQVGLADTTALIDPLAFQPQRPLLDLLENPANCCVMHSASEDMEALAELLPHGPGRLFDTQVAAALCGLGAGLSYQRLVLEITGETLQKGETRSDWLQRPLTRSQCEYAALDVVHLHAIHEQLHALLARLGRVQWLDEEGQRICRRAERDRIDPQPQRGLGAAADWPREQQALLRRILLWREATARELDQPRPWLFNDKQALDLAAHPPVDLGQLREQMRGQRAMRAPQCKALLEELRRPVSDQEAEATADIPPPLDGRQRNLVKRLQQAVATLAAELDVPPGLLCPRKRLEELLATGSWPTTLEGWRKPLLEPVLAPLLPD